MSEIRFKYRLLPGAAPDNRYEFPRVPGGPDQDVVSFSMVLHLLFDLGDAGNPRHCEYYLPFSFMTRSPAMRFDVPRVLQYVRAHLGFVLGISNGAPADWTSQTAVDMEYVSAYIQWLDPGREIIQVEDLDLVTQFSRLLYATNRLAWLLINSPGSFTRDRVVHHLAKENSVEMFSDTRLLNPFYRRGGAIPLVDLSDWVTHTDCEIYKPA